MLGCFGVVLIENFVRIDSLLPDVQLNVFGDHLSLDEVVAGRWCVFLGISQHDSALARRAPDVVQFASRHLASDVVLVVCCANSSMLPTAGIEQGAPSNLVYAVLQSDAGGAAASTLFDPDEHSLQYYIVSPAKRVQIIGALPSIGDLNFAEIGRALEALRSTYGEFLATPANWESGAPLIVQTALADEEAVRRYGPLDIVFSYLRYVSPVKSKSDD